jgi:hypothetical protein
MKNRKGAAFLVVVILSAFILLLVGLLAILGQANYKNQAQNLIAEKALTIAEKGINALINPSGSYTLSSFVAEDRIVLQEDNQSFYWTKAVPSVPVSSFMVDGFPDPNNAPDPENKVTYDIFTVYSVGAVTEGQLTNLTVEQATALLKGAEGVSSARVIFLTVVEKENKDGTLSFVANTENPPEIVSDDGWISASEVPEGEGELPRKSDWQETTLTAFFAER